MSTSLRYLAMLDLIPRDPKSVTVTEIVDGLYQNGFEIDRRSVQRDLNKLSAIFDIECVPDGRTLQWKFKAAAKQIMLPSMDDHTALSFLMLKRHASSLLPPDSLKYIDPWVRKASEKLSSRIGNEARWHEKIYVIDFGIPRLPPKINSQVRDRLYRCVLAEQVISIDYRRRGEKDLKKHVVSPLGIVHKNPVEYLIGHISGFKPVVYALHRIASVAECPGEKFERPSRDWINLQQYAESNFGYPLSGEPKVQIKVIVRGETLTSVKESPIGLDQMLRDTKDGVVLTVTMPNNFDLWLWLRSRGSDILLIEPKEIKKQLAGEFVVLSKWYNPS